MRAERRMQTDKASKETKFRLYTGMNPGFEMICCLAFASTSSVFVGARRMGGGGVCVTDDHSCYIACMIIIVEDGCWVPRGSPYYFLYFYSRFPLPFLLKLLKLSHLLRVKKKQNKILIMAYRVIPSPITSLTSLPPTLSLTLCYSLSSPGTLPPP